jgi:hypothetical protein
MRLITIITWQNLSAGETFKLSCLELSQDRGLRDLLATKAGSELRMREHPDDGPFVENLTWLDIRTVGRLAQVRARHSLGKGGMGQALSAATRRRL